MSYERNVDALRLALVWAGAEAALAYRLAPALASRGVLVPAALTEAEADELSPEMRANVFIHELEAAASEPHTNTQTAKSKSS